MTSKNPAQAENRRARRNTFEMNLRLHALEPDQDRGELAGHRNAQGLHGRGDRNADARGDQGVFDRCRSGLVRDESGKQAPHWTLPLAMIRSNRKVSATLMPDWLQGR